MRQKPSKARAPGKNQKLPLAVHCPRRKLRKKQLLKLQQVQLLKCFKMAEQAKNRSLLLEVLFHKDHQKRRNNSFHGFLKKFTGLLMLLRRIELASTPALSHTHSSLCLYPLYSPHYPLRLIRNNHRHPSPHRFLKSLLIIHRPRIHPFAQKPCRFKPQPLPVFREQLDLRVQGIDACQKPFDPGSIDQGIQPVGEPLFVFEIQNAVVLTEQVGGFDGGVE